jgi:hypothetical protein
MVRGGPHPQDERMLLRHVTTFFVHHQMPAAAIMVGMFGIFMLGDGRSANRQAKAL